MKFKKGPTKINKLKFFFKKTDGLVEVIADKTELSCYAYSCHKNERSVYKIDGMLRVFNPSTNKSFLN